MSPATRAFSATSVWPTDTYFPPSYVNGAAYQGERKPVFASEGLWKNIGDVGVLVVGGSVAVAVDVALDTSVLVDARGWFARERVSLRGAGSASRVDLDLDLVVGLRLVLVLVLGMADYFWREESAENVMLKSEGWGVPS